MHGENRGNRGYAAKVTTTIFHNLLNSKEKGHLRNLGNPAGSAIKVGTVIGDVEL